MLEANHIPRNGRTFITREALQFERKGDFRHKISKGGKGMVKKSFIDIASEAIEIIKEEKSIPDVMLMIRLGFNPEGWRRWRTKLIELFKLRTFPDNSKNTSYCIEYVTKQKLWQIKEV